MNPVAIELSPISLRTLAEHTAAMDTFSATLGKLNELAKLADVVVSSSKGGSARGQATVHEMLTALRGGSAAYSGTFSKLVEAVRARGLTPNVGIQGVFRESVHALEKALGDIDRADLKLSLLQMRRSEKDYQLRRTTDAKKYRDATLAEAGRLDTMLASLPPVQATPMQMATALDRLANGDFTVTTETRRRDELGDMIRAMNGTAEALRTAIGDIATQASAVQAKAAEVDGVTPPPKRSRRPRC